ncbi:MAG: hypothetical protein LBF12_07365 [Christensenellaceae bacterium]|jgi:hypothetical protein|nr:hypothetical protein [Christensenellaceae bacterium]
MSAKQFAREYVRLALDFGALEITVVKKPVLYLCKSLFAYYRRIHIAANSAAETYDLTNINSAENKDLFEFHSNRPFFKDLQSIEKYFHNLKEFSGLKYAIYQYEQGENDTKHIQGFVIYKNSKRFVNVKQDFPTAHIEPANGSNTDNRNYCTKTDTRIADPVEKGEFSEMRSRNDIKELLETLELGANNALIKKPVSDLLRFTHNSAWTK